MTGYGVKQMNSNSTGLSSRFAGLHAQASLSTLAADEMSDAQLIERIAAADERAMQVFYERHYQTVYRLVCRSLHSTQSAEDIASDVFLEVWCKAGSFQGRSEVSTWLFAIARNKSISVRRQRSSEPWDEAVMESIEDDADGPELKLQKQSTDSTVRKCLDQLSPAHRVVIDLVYFHDKSTADAAKTVGIARNTVKTRLFYARKQLTELLGAQGIVTASA
jgi:RNA polymerase sigma-70 factor (ECF subfamily)